MIQPDPIATLRDPAPLPGTPSTVPLDRIIDRLLDAGLNEPQAIATASAVRSISNEMALTLAAQFIRYLMRRLGKTAAAEALARAVLGDGGESLREAARRANCSHVNILQLEKDVRERLGLPVAGNR